MGAKPRPPGDVRALLPRRLPPILKLTASTFASMLVGFALSASGFSTVGTVANAIVLTWFFVRVHRDKLASEPRSPSLRNSAIFYLTLTLMFFLAVVAGTQSNDDAFAGFPLGIFFTGLAARALHFDYANARYAGQVQRSERPMFYWFLTGSLALAGWTLLIGLTWELGRAKR
jgi:hypothetical protein